MVKGNILWYTSRKINFNDVLFLFSKFIVNLMAFWCV